MLRIYAAPLLRANVGPYLVRAPCSRRLFLWVSSVATLGDCTLRPVRRPHLRVAGVRVTT